MIKVVVHKPARTATPTRRKPVITARADNDGHTLLAQAATQPPIALPHRAALEARFGRRLDQIAVYAGPLAQAVLALLRAEALTYQGAIFLADPNPPLELVAHEVVHVLQMKGGTRATGPQPAEAAIAGEVAGRSEDGVVQHEALIVPATAPAEREAITLAAQAQRENTTPLTPPLIVNTTLPPAAVALRRATTPAPPTDEPAAATFRRVAEREPAPAPPAQTVAPPTPDSSSLPNSGPPPTIEPDQPPFTLPPPPAPEVSAADLAAQQAAQARAEASLANAEGPEAFMTSFVAAPPTLKAQRTATLGSDIERLTQEEQATFSAELPDLHAQLNTQVETPPPLTVASPDARSLDLDVASALPQLDLPPTPEPERYTANDHVTADISRLMSGETDDRAANLAERLHEINTRDSEVVTSPGAPPRVPLTKGADPAQLNEQINEGVTQSRAMGDEAAQAVINGPGPEQAQPIALDEAYPVDELVQPEIVAPEMPTEPQAYLEMGLPPEVQTAFDQQQQAAMENSLAEARTQMDEASAERDQQRAAAVAEAQAQAQEQSARADEQQRNGVLEAREQIQDARQETLNAQRDAVTDVEQQATAERTARRREIDERVRADEAQIEQHYATAERDARAEVAEGERRAESERQRAEREAEEESWWDRAVNFVRDAFTALTRVISAIFDAVRSVVNAILDAVKALAMRIIDAAAAFVNGLIAAFGELLKGLVDTLIGSIFPELAARLNAAIDSAVAFAQRVVTAAADGLKAGIAALVEGLRAGLNAIINVYQAAINAVLSIAQAVLTGDWAALARMALEAVLKVAGIDPETFYQFIGRAQETFQLILDDPGGFVGHLVDAFLDGVRRFADNFLTHLQAGIIGWLTGALGGAGITLPERFDLMGVLSLIQQILGLTWERLRERAVRLIGERAVAVIEFVAGYLRTLIEGGWEALWQRIRDDLATLRDLVLDSIKSFLLERIVMAAITRLATMFNPVGAIVNLILAAYNFFTFLRDQLARIIEVVQTVVNAIGDIARGIIQPAAQRVEETLARLLPLAIDLLARLLGLGNVGNKVREIIERVRGVVDRAIDRLINRVRNMFSGDGAGTTAGSPVAGAATAVQVPDSTASNVKTQALNAIRQRTRSQRFQSLDGFQSMLAGVYREFQPQGLRSLSVRIVDETTMEAEIQATASAPERLSIAWQDLFGAQDDAIRLFAVQPRNETNAALSINGARFGEVVASNDQGHAEQNLLARYWETALQRARENVARGITTTIAIAINRSPCHNICTPALVAAMNRVEPELKRQVRFVLAPTGVYEPTERLTDAEVQQETIRLTQLARIYGRSVSALLHEQLSRVRYTRDTTTFNDLGRLVAAGWDIAQLQARSVSTQAGIVLAEAAHKVMREAQRLRVGAR